jgi:predicted Zn-dependent protease
MRHTRPLISLACLAAALVACGVNPVTGKKELQVVSQQEELAIGKQQYAPSRQGQGGDLVTDPKLTAYVAKVGSRVAEHAKRELPYEFVVLASGVPNAWALPGGKIAVNRGLLLELEDEAELAAVLGHEVVHADARHGAQGIERGLLAQIGMVAVAIGVQGEDNSAVLMGSAMLGAQLITTKYGRDAELESDKYGTRYMAAAGYDPRAAISLQEKFVKLSAGKSGGWLEGMFASHPPSQERVNANRKHADALMRKLGATTLEGGGARGRDDYQAATAGIRKGKEAYAAYDAGQKLLAKDPKGALAQAEKAIKLEPREALFHSLAGTAQQKLGDPAAARRSYDAALARNPDYFEFWLRRGLLRQKLNDPGAKADLEKAHAMLPTKTSAEALGLPAK